ncbi:hypothetical protein DJ52_15640, partial [Brachyspira murdochii]
DLPESDDKLSADVDNLDLPEDLNDNALPTDDDDLGLPEDLADNALPTDDDDLGLPEDLDIADDDLNLHNLSDEDDLGLPEDKELEDKIAKDINEADSVKNDIKADKLPVLNDDLPLPDTLPNVDDDYQDEALENDDKENDIGIDDISDSLDDILEDDDLNELDNLENILDDDNLDKEETEETLDDDLDLNNS